MDSTTSFPPAAGLSRTFEEVEALDRAGRDAMLRELVQLFRGEGARILRDMRVAIVSGDTEQLQRLAHTLKGSAGAVSGHAVALAARDLEVIAGQSNAVATEQALDTLESEFRRLLAAFAESPTLKPIAVGGPTFPDLGIADHGGTP